MNCSNCGNREKCYFVNSEWCPPQLGWIQESRPAPDADKIERTGEDGLIEKIYVPFEVI